MPERRDLEFSSHGERCAAWHYAGSGGAFERDGARPCVVMAHGIGGTRDSGLEPFAEAFADAGLDVLLFDYRGFGASSGEPRQLAWPPRHRQDYRAAVTCACGLEGVDPRRIVLWGTSWSGGHVIHVAAGHPAVAAVISQTPDVDGLRTLGQLVRYAGPGHLTRITAAGLRDAYAALRGRDPAMIPIVADPGEVAAISSEGSKAGYEAIAGPSWRNEITARAVLYEGRNRAITKLDDVSCPLLIQSADDDSVAPPVAAEAAAWKAKGRAEAREYACTHFDIYVGEWRERAIADQLHFLRRHLGSTEPQRAERRERAARA